MRFIKFLSVVIFSIIQFSCVSNVQESKVEYVVYETSFEKDSLPDYTGWYGTINKESFFKDAPLDGGIWSLMLEPRWAPQEGYAETYITKEEGEGIYKLKAWVKNLDSWRGVVSLGLKRDGKMVRLKSAISYSKSWEEVVIQDTFSVLKSDTIVIKLSAGMTEVATAKVLFDKIMLLKN